MVACPKCTKEINPATSFCPHCGSPLAKPATADVGSPAAAAPAAPPTPTAPPTAGTPPVGGFDAPPNAAVIWFRANRNFAAVAGALLVGTTAFVVIKLRGSTPEAMTKQYLGASKWEDRLDLVRDPDLVRPMMAEAYSGEYKPTTYLEIKPAIKDSHEGHEESLVPVVLKKGKNGFGQDVETEIFVFLANTDDGLKIDWEATRPANPLTWPAFMAQRPTTKATYRFVGTLATYYNYDFQGAQNSHYSVTITSLDGDYTGLHGYVPKSGADGVKLYNILKDGRSHLLMGALRFLPGGQGNDVAIDHLHSGWIVYDRTTDRDAPSATPELARQGPRPRAASQPNEEARQANEATPKRCPGGVIPGSVEVFSAHDIETLKGCTAIAGNLSIGDPELSKGLETLAGLETLTSIGGQLTVAGPALTSLAGLSGLRSVGTTINTDENSDLKGILMGFSTPLTSLAGLENLETVGGGIEISNAPKLTNLSSLSRLRSIKGKLSIYHNQALTSLAGLNNVVSVKGDLFISECPLESLEGLESLTSVGGALMLHDIPGLTSIAALDRLKTLNGHLQIFQTALPKKTAKDLAKRLGAWLDYGG